jgi:hypothetical protein
MTASKAAALLMATVLMSTISMTARVSAADEPGAAGASANVSAQLEKATVQLSELEQAASSIETSNVVPAETAVQIGTALSAYAESMHVAADGALEAANVAAKTKGASGSVEPLAMLEKTASAHEPRTKALQRRLAAISEKVKGGSIKTVALVGGRRITFAAPPAMQALFARLNAPIVSPAQAMLAIPALQACINKNWAQCAILIATAIPAAKTAWNTYQTCQSNAPGVPSQPSPPSGRPYYSYPIRYAQYLVQMAHYIAAVIARAAYQANCVATFVAKIA